MKFEQIILTHLAEYGQVTLQGIGTLAVVNENQVAKSPGGVVNKLPQPSCIRFRYDQEAGSDPELIDSVVQSTRKLRSLAQSDLESFLSWQKQLINISLAFELAPLGCLRKSTAGDVIFVPSKSIHVQAPPAWMNQVKSVLKMKLPKKRFVLATVVVLAVILTSWVIQSFLSTGPAVVPVTSKEREASTIVPDPVIVKSTVVQSTIGRDRLPAPPTTFTVVFFRSGNIEEAKKTLYYIYGFGHPANLYRDSQGYNVAIPFTEALQDTSHIKDSLETYYSLGKGLIDVR